MTDWHVPQDPTTDEREVEHHPAWGMISARRVQGGDKVLFDSDVRHHHTVQITLGRATRQRDLARDWIHGDRGDLVEVEMSEAQWASFVSSMNTSGVPCTLRRLPDDWNIPGLHHAPRLAESIREVTTAADEGFGDIRKAMERYLEVLGDKTARAADKREALNRLTNAVRHSTSHADFVAKSLVEHAENVVQKARADVEAMVYTKARQLGLDPGDFTSPLSLPAAEDEPIDVQAIES